MTTRHVPTTCPHCGASIVLASPHCRTQGGAHPTCTWVTCPCKATIDASGRHTHPEHKPTYTVGARCHS